MSYRVKRLCFLAFLGVFGCNGIQPTAKHCELSSGHNFPTDGLTAYYFGSDGRFDPTILMDAKFKWLRQFANESLKVGMSEVEELRSSKNLIIIEYCNERVGSSGGACVNFWRNRYCRDEKGKLLSDRQAMQIWFQGGKTKDRFGNERCHVPVHNSEDWLSEAHYPSRQMRAMLLAPNDTPFKEISRMESKQMVIGRRHAIRNIDGYVYLDGSEIVNAICYISEDLPLEEKQLLIAECFARSHGLYGTVSDPESILAGREEARSINDYDLRRDVSSQNCIRYLTDGSD